MPIKLTKVVQPWEIITACERECFPGEQLTLKEIANTVWWLARAGDKIAGYLGSSSTGVEGVWEIARIGVRSQFRGQHIGQRLLRKAEKDLVKYDNCKELRTYTAHWNIWSANILIRSGYLMWRPDTELEEGTWNYWRKEIR